MLRDQSVEATVEIEDGSPLKEAFITRCRLFDVSGELVPVTGFLKTYEARFEAWFQPLASVAVAERGFV